MRSFWIIYLLLTGPYCVDRNQLRPIIKEHQSQFAEIGINLKTRRVYVQADTAPASAYLLKNSHYRFSILQNRRWDLSRKKYPLLRSGLVHIFFPPTQEPDGTRYILGGSSGVCKRRGTSMSSVTLVNQDGQPRARRCAAGCSHEVCHLVGCSAEHPTDHSIGDSAVLLYSDNGNHFNDASAAQVRSCVEKWK